MPGFRRRPLAVFICCAFAGLQAAHAEVPATLSSGPIADTRMDWLPGTFMVTSLPVAADDQALRLRLERKFEILSPKPRSTAPSLPGMPPQGAGPRKKDEYPVFLVADVIRGRSDESTEAEGSAELRKFGSRLLADRITYWPLEDEVEALGNVVLQQRDDELSGPHLRIRLADQVGFFEAADYKFRKEVISRFYRPVLGINTTFGTTSNTGSAPLMISVPSGYGLPTTVPSRRSTEGYGHAERIDFEGENQVRLTDATYSTCKPDDTDWYLRGREFQLDYDNEVGDVRSATLVFKDIPIFYTPVGSFSLNRQRKTGFLAGHLAASSKNGLDLTLPYYWNIAPNYDVTFYPREMSKRGFQLGTEARYVDFNYSGFAKVEYLPQDDVLKRSRHAYNFYHVHNLGRGFGGLINWNGVSDDFYWQDFSSRLLQTTQAQLPKQLMLGYAPGSWWTANVQTLRYQTLQPDPKNPVARPYFIEPQINFSGRVADIRKADFSVIGQYTNFTHPTLTEGGRTVFYPQVTVPYISPALTVMPKVGLHATQYSLNRQAAGAEDGISRVLPIFSLDTTAFFEREDQWQGRNYIQTLEPRLYYVYIPYKKQDQIPVFDTALADFNFSQIFNENRYVGYDRINDANQLTAAVTSRFLNGETGAERFKAMIGQRYYFRPQRVTLPGEAVRPDNFSNFLAAFSGVVLPKTYVDAAWEYNHQSSQSERYSIGARYQPDLAKVISASYRYTRDALGKSQVDQVDVAGQWPIAKGWYAVGRYNYSLRDKQVLESIAGLEYNAGCWAARFVVQRLEALSGGASNTTLFFQLELNDFASVGSSPLQLLRRTIPGYGKVNEMPTSGSLLTTQ